MMNGEDGGVNVEFHSERDAGEGGGSKAREDGRSESISPVTVRAVGLGITTESFTDFEMSVRHFETLEEVVC